MKHFDMFLFGKVHEVDEGTGLFKSIGLAFALEAPAFPVTAQVKGITVHAEFELSVAVFPVILSIFNSPLLLVYPTASMPLASRKSLGVIPVML